MSQAFPLVIVGGSSFVAQYLMQRLVAQEMTASVIARHPIDVPPGLTFTQLDFTQARNWIAPENAVVVSLLPLWLLAKFLPRFIGVKSIIAVSSTSRFSKASSSDQKERLTASSLEQAENTILAWCQRSNVHGTLLRPTLIYDGIHDNNIARMARFIKRFRFLPLAAPATGLRQPIHGDDVAKALFNAINNPAVHGKSLNIAGGEILSYRAMVERVFETLNIKPRLIMLPTEWLEKGFRWGTNAGILNERSFGSSIFRRMNEDLVFDVEEGLPLLKYEPRNFIPTV